MREAALYIRERDWGGGALPWSFVMRHRPTWGVAAGGALLLAGVGAFDTGASPALALYPYWTILMFIGGAMIAFGSERMDRVAAQRLSAALVGATVVIGTSLSMTPIVFLMSWFMLDNSWEPGHLPQLAGQSLLVTTIFYAAHWIAQRNNRPPQPAMAEPASPASLRSRLPLHLRSAVIEALQAEDHYLRVHTEHGSTLILMSLSEALAAVEAADGLQTHRSWWAARSAVVASARRGVRASLTLRSGLRVPVSRTHAPALRRDGWFNRSAR